MAEAKPLKIQRGDKSLDRANRVVATHIIFHTRRKKARLIPAHPGLEGTIRHIESYTALHKRLGSCPASALHPGYGFNHNTCDAPGIFRRAAVSPQLKITVSTKPI